MFPRSVVLLLLAAPALFARDPATWPATSPATRPAPVDVSQTMSLEQVEPIYRRELEGLWTPRNSKQVYDAHRLIEDYFDAAGAEPRRQVVRSIEATGLSPALLGRLTRIHLRWPQVEGGVYYVNEKVGPHPVRYFVGVPRSYDRVRRTPLVVMLPTFHVYETDPPPTEQQLVDIHVHWIRQRLDADPNALILIPLMNPRERWGPSLPGMASVVQPILHAAGRFNVDPSRIHLFAHSIAAASAWNIALHQPTYFASFAALAGGAGAEFQRLRVVNLWNVKPVVWHDADDPVIPVRNSRELVAILRRFRIDVDYEETKGHGHVPPAESVERAWQAMRQAARNLYPDEVRLQSNRRESMFNRADWLQVYGPIQPGGEQKAFLRTGTGPLVMNANVHTATATIDRVENAIDIRTDNVDSLRVYLNDQMVNLDRPVKLAVNGRVRFEGVVRPQIDEMLKDQLYLGRGFRYYLAAIDVVAADTRIPASQPQDPPATSPRSSP